MRSTSSSCCSRFAPGLAVALAACASPAPPALPPVASAPIAPSTAPAVSAIASTSATPPVVGPASAAPANPPGPCPAGMLAIPAGTFQMGSADGDPDERPVRSVTLPAFCLDTTEVTTAAYAACVSAGKCDATGLRFAPECTTGAAGRETHPVNCANLEQARTFCAGRDARLPSEEEWEYAARGGSEERTYPWGQAAPATQLCWSGRERRTGECPAGAFREDVGRWGVLDLGGNLSEWTSSPYAGGPPQAPYPERFAVRGGHWSMTSAATIRSAHRSGEPPHRRSFLLGFRCARAAR